MEKIIGYAQLYFRIVGEIQVYYACFDGDFGKPLSLLRLLSIKRSMKRAYERYDTVYSVHFCTKEEWEKNHCGDEITVSWGQENEINRIRNIKVKKTKDFEELKEKYRSK